MINFDKKDFTIYKNILKKMLMCTSKFGLSKNKDDIVNIYHYIDEKNRQLYPVLLLSQDKNPWGDIFYPSTLFINGINFPEDIDIFNTDKNKNYLITDSVSVNLSNFKKDLNDLKDVELIKDDKGCYINFPNILNKFKDRKKHYVDTFKYKDTINVIKLLKYNSNTMNVITDNSILEQIHSNMSENTKYTLKINDEGNVLKIFFSIAPLKMDRLDYIRYLHINDNEVTSTVYLKQYIKNIVINNFYKYIDIWSLVNKGDKSNG